MPIVIDRRTRQLVSAPTLTYEQQCEMAFQIFKNFCDRNQEVFAEKINSLIEEDKNGKVDCL